MLINGAWTAYEHAEHLLAGHADKAAFYMATRMIAFPNAPFARVHATLSYEAQKQKNPLVTDWWDQSMVTGATSAGKAARIGIAKLGFDRVVLCGCPMDGSGYFAEEGKIPHDCRRVGDPTVQEAKPIRMYREHLKVLATREPFKSQLFSMSGFSREVLGAPR